MSLIHPWLVDPMHINILRVLRNIAGKKFVYSCSVQNFPSEFDCRIPLISHRTCFCFLNTLCNFLHCTGRSFFPQSPSSPAPVYSSQEAQIGRPLLQLVELTLSPGLPQSVSFAPPLLSQPGTVSIPAGLPALTLSPPLCLASLSCSLPRSI